MGLPGALYINLNTPLELRVFMDKYNLVNSDYDMILRQFVDDLVTKAIVYIYNPEKLENNDDFIKEISKNLDINITKEVEDDVWMIVKKLISLLVGYNLYDKICYCTFVNENQIMLEVTKIYA